MATSPTPLCDMEQKKEVELSCGEQMCKKDSKKFTKYVESTTAHGVVRIFSGKSTIRRLFWAVIFLGAMAGCLYNISNRIIFLLGNPTSTTLQLVSEENLTFPAVTICNINSVRRDFLQERGLFHFFRTAALLEPGQPDFQSDCDNLVSEFSGSVSDSDALSFTDIQEQGRHSVDNFVLSCRFLGRLCNITENFTPTFTQLGYCYTFNSSEVTNGTGPRNGLQLILNIEQDQFVVSSSNLFDVGVKVAIHTQDEPPRPNDRGIGVPPGRNAFLALNQKRVIDETRRNCKLRDASSQFHFLQQEFSYSVPACLDDCFYSNLAEMCGCIETGSQFTPDSDRFANYPDCNINNTCCYIEQIYRPESCNCVSACEYTTFDISTSYTAFPAKNSLQTLIEVLQNETGEAFPTNMSFYEENFLSIDIYFESLNVELQTTKDAYGVVALLSDIGGQLGLFLGVSVISVMEFVTWVVDELKDRCCGVSERKLKKMMRNRAKEKEPSANQYHEYSSSKPEITDHLRKPEEDQL